MSCLQAPISSEPGGSPADLKGDRSRIVAELLIRRLGRKDYELIMEGMNWEIWNRILVWMLGRARGGRRTARTGSAGRPCRSVPRGNGRQAAVTLI
jgi:hypothetical protein